MVTVQVQPAGATPTVANTLSGAPSADGTFAATFGRALEGMSETTENSSPRASRAPSAFAGSARPKGAASNSPEPASLVAMALTCFLSNIIQPASPPPRSIGPGSSTTGAPAGETASNSIPVFGADSTIVDVNPQSKNGAVPSAPTSDAAVSATKLAETSNYMKPGEIPNSGSTAQPRTVGRERSEAGNPAIGFNVAVEQAQTPEAPSFAVAPLPDSLPSLPASHGVGRYSDSAGLEVTSELNPKVVPDPSFAQARPKNARPSSLAATTVAADNSEPTVLPSSVETATPFMAGQPTDEATVQTQQTAAASGPRLAEPSSSSNPDGNSTIAVAVDGYDPTAQSGQTASAAAPGATDRSPRTSSNGDPEIDGLSKLSGYSEVKAISFRSSKTNAADASIAGPSPQPTTMGSRSVSAVTARPRPSAPSAAESQVSAEAKVESSNHGQSEASKHLARTSGEAPAGPADKDDPKPEIVMTQTLYSTPPSAVAPQPTEPKLQPAANPGEVRRPAEAELRSAHGALAAGSSDLSSHDSTANSSASSQEKSGQQGGTGSSETPAAVVPIEHNSANNAVPDPAINGVAVHTAAIPVGHAASSVSSGESIAPQPPATLSAWQNYDGGAGSIVRSASLTGAANSAEMRVEFRSGALGPLEVHAVMHDGTLGAEIHVQGQEAHTLLAAGLPSLERALGERNLHVGNIGIYQDNAGGGTSGGSEQNPNSGSSAAPRHERSPWGGSPPSGSVANGISEDETLANPALGLSVRA
jgi:flagellar hook-length control protein FliK